MTKMVTFPGWKRFEMNDTMKFHGVTEATFPFDSETVACCQL